MLSVAQALWVNQTSERWRGVVDGGHSLESLPAFSRAAMSERERGREREGDVPDMIALATFSAIVGLWIWAAIRNPFLRSSARKKSPEPGWMMMVSGVELVGGGDMVQDIFFSTREKEFGLLRLVQGCGLPLTMRLVWCCGRGSRGALVVALSLASWGGMGLGLVRAIDQSVHGSTIVDKKKTSDGPNPTQPVRV